MLEKRKTILERLEVEGLGLKKLLEGKKLTKEEQVKAKRIYSKIIDAIENNTYFGNPNLKIYGEPERYVEYRGSNYETLLNDVVDLAQGKKVALGRNKDRILQEFDYSIEKGNDEFSFNDVHIVDVSENANGKALVRLMTYFTDGRGRKELAAAVLTDENGRMSFMDTGYDRENVEILTDEEQKQLIHESIQKNKDLYHVLYRDFPDGIIKEWKATRKEAKRKNLQKYAYVIKLKDLGYKVCYAYGDFNEEFFHDNYGNHYSVKQNYIEESYDNDGNLECIDMPCSMYSESNINITNDEENNKKSIYEYSEDQVFRTLDTHYITYNNEWEKLSEESEYTDGNEEDAKSFYDEQDDDEDESLATYNKYADYEDNVR